MAAAGQKKVSSPLDVANSAAVVTVAVRADTRRACSGEKLSFFYGPILYREKKEKNWVRCDSK